MAVLGQSSVTLLSSTLVDMKTAANTALFTVPVARYLRISHIVVRDPTASLAGGTSYSITNWRLTFSLVSLITSPTGYVVLETQDLTQYVESGPSVVINFTVTTGSTAAANATIDLFGYLTT